MRLPHASAPSTRLAIVTACLLAACGGGGNTSSGAPASAQTAGTVSGDAGSAQALPTLAVAHWHLAQTHVLPPEGLRWSQPEGKTLALHLVGGRAALALVEIAGAAPTTPQMEGRIGSTVLGQVALQDNNALPPTESNGERFSSTARVAMLPGAWLKPGLELRITASQANPSAWQAVKVGADTSLDIRSLPFYLFGATEQMVSLDAASKPSSQAMDELVAKWPIARLTVLPHPAGKVVWPQLVVNPRNGNSAYVMNSAEDRKDGFDPLSAVLNTLGQIREANGESITANQYYAGLIQGRAAGGWASAGGGLGGGHNGAGDTTFSGIFIHEQGHAFGMPHAGESYASGSGYPYPGGSLAGSAWGFDQVRQRFMSTRVPTSASTHGRCATQSFGGTPRQVDAQGRCIRQDPMQSGSGDQAAGDIYTLFSDYNAGVIQKYLEGVASLDAKGNTVWDGGRIQESSASATGYRRWNSLASAWQAVDPAVDSNSALYGINNNLPAQRGVPVYTLVVNHSNAGTPGVSMVMPPIGPYTGNLPRMPDPTQAADLAALKSGGPWVWWCSNYGCDFTLRVTYATGAVRHVALQKAFRGWFAPSGAPAASATNPVDSASFRRWVVNVSADAPLAKVELLDTPMLWNGLPTNPAVLAARSLP